MPHDFYAWSFVDAMERTDLWGRVGEALGPLEWTADSEHPVPDELARYRHPAVHELHLWVWPTRGEPSALVASCSEHVAHGPGLPHVLHALTEVHIALGSLRTVWGWELGETLEFDAAAELARLRRGEVETLYWFDITRRSLTSPERREALRDHAERTRGAVFHPLPNGDWAYRGRLSELP